MKKYLFLYASLMTSCIYCIVTVSIKGNEDYKITLKISWQKRGLTIQRTQNVKIMLLHSRLFQCRNVKGSHEDEARIEKIFADPFLKTYFHLYDICFIRTEFSLEGIVWIIFLVHQMFNVHLILAKWCNIFLKLPSHTVRNSTLKNINFVEN